ncbi:hypothetical protein [Candidatus Binatus sp.]|uniref:hypothetical protein n=1 Tax=Candidatus Binatus sp. TaxID=2811406 RepID=UPI002F9334BB
MKLIERIDLADKRRAGKGASARSDRPPGAGATRRPSRPTAKARPADRYRRCFEQVMTEIEDFERWRSAVETALILIAGKVGIPF